ncbi:MAG: hypothetical protein ACRC9L_02515 [Brevinema sp.]
MKKTFLKRIPLKLLDKYISNPQIIGRYHRLECILLWQQHQKGFFHADFLGMISILNEEQPETISFRQIYHLCRSLSWH